MLVLATIRYFLIPWFKNSWLKSLWLKSQGLKDSGEKSRVEISFNHFSFRNKYVRSNNILITSQLFCQLRMFNDLYHLIISYLPKSWKVNNFKLMSKLRMDHQSKSSDSSNFVINFDLSFCSVSKLWIPLLLVIQPFLSSGRKQRCRGVIWPQKGTGDQNIIGACPKFQTRHCLVWGLSELLNIV